jgi:PAS domain S-box-containing protein
MDKLLVNEKIFPILNELFDGIIIVNRNFKIIQWNKSISALVGISFNNAINQQLFDLIPSLKECDYYLNKAVLEENRTIELIDFPLKKPKSETLVHLHAKFIPILSKDKVNHIIINLKEKKQNTNYLSLLESVVVNCNDAILITQAEAIDGLEEPRIIYANPAFSMMTGYELHEVLGKTPRVLQGKETSKKARKKIRTALENWEKVNCELVNYKKTGEKFWVDLDIVPIKNEEGYYTHWTSIQRETTHHKEILEELRVLNEELELKIKERTEELENFSFFLAHDLKQPTRVITSFIALIKRKGLTDDTIKEYFDYIEQSSESINSMVDSLTQLMVLRKKQLHYEASEVKEILFQVKHNLKEVIESSKAVIHLSDIPSIKMDFDLMVHVFQNLIENAIRYKTEESPVVKIYSTTSQEYIAIHIEDNGIGFVEEEMEEIFTLFKKSRNNVNTAGFGIGLSICKRIMENHNGKIHIDANENIGSTITLQLPINLIVSN